VVGIRLILLAAFSLVACSFERVADGDVPQVWPGEAWATATPQEEGIPRTVIDSLVGEMEAGDYGLIDRFLLIRHGRAVADYSFHHDYVALAAAYDTTNQPYNYDHPDWHPYYRGSELHTLQSVTKSINAVALGIAIDEGYITGVEAPAMPFFDAYDPALSDPRRTAMTLEDMLTMRSGIDWNEMISYDDASNSCIQMEGSNDWIGFVLSRPMRENPGSRWDYNSGVSVLLGKIVGLATGRRVDAWTEEKLFRPLGIKDYYWKTTPMGEVDTEGGLYLSAQDLARIGYLYLRGGVWNGERVVSEAWIRASTSPVVPDIRPDNDRPDSGYGYQWWVPDHDGSRARVYSANGYGGQYLFVVPEYDLVAVFNGWNIHGGAPRSYGPVLQTRIIPAIQASQGEPEAR